jgi:hypothetical protein
VAIDGLPVGLGAGVAIVAPPGSGAAGTAARAGTDMPATPDRDLNFR